MRTLLAALCVVFSAGTLLGAVKGRTVEYKHGETVLEGYLAFDDTWTSPRPGILVVHEWKGLGEYAKKRARDLVSEGFVAFALDMYGKGIRAKDNKEAGALAGKYRSDRALQRSRAQAGLDVLQKQPLVDATRTAAIGYCFGGGTVLELARSGADIKGAVSFHGNLDTPDPSDARNIKAKVLVLHGADDPHVSSAQVQAFQEEMRKAGVDWQFIAYGGAVHSFTNPGSGSDPSQGVAYNAKADARSWGHMMQLFKELFP